MESLNYTDVESITTSFAGSDSPRVAFTHNFYNDREAVTVNHASWIIGVRATREATGDEFFASVPGRPSRKDPTTFARLSAFEGNSPYKRAESVTVTPNGRLFTTTASKVPVRKALWNPTRLELTPFFMESRANAPTEETTYVRRDQKVINMALQHRRMAISKPHVSRDSGEGGSRDTGGEDGGASRVDPGSDIEEETPARRVFWDPARNL